MTIYPELDCLKNLFAFYDGELKYLLSRGFARDEAEYLIKHFIECFADDPERYREDLIYETEETRKNQIQLNLTAQRLARELFINGPTITELRKQNKIKSNLGWLVERE